MGAMNHTTSVTIHFNFSTWRFRVAAFVRSLRRPRIMFVLLVLFAFPVALMTYAWWIGSMPGNAVLYAAFVVVGALGCIVAMVRRPPLGAITFSEEGIREHVGSEVFEHEWRWIVDVVEDDQRLTLHCEEPRPFRLARPRGRNRLLVIDRSSAEAPIIKALLAAHRGS